MRGHKRVITEKTHQWMLYGDEDLHMARHSLTIKAKCPYRLIAYHAQQCAEKYVKAFLVNRGIDFPFTHNLSRLIELCPMSEEWKNRIVDAEELSPFAVSARYPGEDEDVSRPEAERAVKIAERLRKVVRNALKKKNRPV